MRNRSAIALSLATAGVAILLSLLLLGTTASGISGREVQRLPLGETQVAVEKTPTPAPQASRSRLHADGEDGCSLFTTIVPDQMTLIGDVTTRANCVHPTVCSWLVGTPSGTIMLGVDPTSPYTSTWDGGSATAKIYIGDIVSPTVGVLTISWPDRDGKGLHSPLKDQVAAITFDGERIWAKRTLEQSTFGDYYAAEHRPVMLTFVVTQSLTHTLVLRVPPHTAWDISQVTIQLCPMPSLIKGLAYSPFRDCQTPHWGDLYPSIAEIREDMPLLFHSANAIRTYSSLNTIGQVPALVHERGLRVSAGAWLGREVDEDGLPVPNKNAEEISGVITIANTVPVESVIVGNEVLLRGDLPITQLIDYIGYVRANVPPTVEVTTAEIWFIWMGQHEDYSQTQIDALVDAVDYIMVHIYPYWDKMSVDGAAEQVIAQYQALQQEYLGKHVVIGEAGWPSAGETNGAAVPTLENQFRFYTEFLDLADQEGIEFYYFDPFDELWKRWPSRDEGGEGEAGAHWGLGYTDRTTKHRLQGVLFPSSTLFLGRVYLPLVLKESNGEQTSPSTALPTPSVLTRKSTAAPPTNAFTFPVYTEWLAVDNHFAPSGQIGDVDSIDLYECERDNPHAGELCIRVTYSASGPLGWAGVYWQEPENNWGTLPGGHDLTAATKLSFWVRGARGGEVVEFRVGGIWGAHPDSIQPALTTGPLVLSKQWQQHSIDLQGHDRSHIIGGFAWAATRCSNPDGAVFYLDDIIYEHDPQPAPTPTPTPVMPYTFDIYTDADAPGNHYVPSGWMGDWPAIELTECWRDDVHSGSTAIRSAYHYTATGSGPANWAGVYWLHPADNWADRPGGHNLQGAQALTFWARGEKGGERVKFQMGGVVSGTSPYNGSVTSSVPLGGWITLSDSWRPYTITLPSELDLSHVVGGFLWATDWEHNCESHSEEIVFYLDDIRYWFNHPSAPTPTPPSPPIPASLPFTVYADARLCGNHFIPSGWMGDLGDIHLQTDYAETAHSGSTAIRITYDAQGKGPWTCGYGQPCQWAGIYWQEPVDNWGMQPGGYDLGGATRLTFWAKGEHGGEKVKFFVGGIGICGDAYPDSLRPALSTDVLALASDWQKYEIDLRGHDLSRVIGGFGWSANQCSNPAGATFYIDDIVFESNPSSATAPTSRLSGSVFAIYTDHDAPGNHYASTGWMGAVEDIDLLECATDDVYSGTTAIRVSYTPVHAPHWAGVYWQEPSGNWADRPGGYNLTGGKRVTFWAKSLVPGAKVTFIVGGIGYEENTCTPQPTVLCPEFLDSVCPAIKKTFLLSNTWQKYEIPIPAVRNLTRVVGGFGWVANEAVTFYLDDITWEISGFTPTSTIYLPVVLKEHLEIGPVHR